MFLISSLLLNEKLNTESFVWLNNRKRRNWEKKISLFQQNQCDKENEAMQDKPWWTHTMRSWYNRPTITNTTVCRRRCRRIKWAQPILYSSTAAYVLNTGRFWCTIRFPMIWNYFIRCGRRWWWCCCRRHLDRDRICIHMIMITTMIITIIIAIAI